jgi:hypothetical protein
MVLHGYVEETTLYPIQYYANITLAQVFYEKQAATLYLVPVFFQLFLHPLAQNTIGIKSL